MNQPSSTNENAFASGPQDDSADVPAVGEDVPVTGGSTSRSLIRGIREHDAEAWDRVVVLYAPLVYHWSRRLGLGEEDAADVFQEVFQSVAANVHAFRRRPRRGSFRGWLKTITRNKVFDHFRRQRREPRATGGTDAQRLLADVPDPERTGDPRTLVDDLLLRALETIRGEFHERTWLAFHMSAVEGRPTTDVAEELGTTPGNVRVAKSRILQRLRRELGDVPE